MAEEKGLKVDETAFTEEQEKAKEVSRARKGGSGEKVVALDVHALGELEKNAAVPKTDDSAKYGKLSAKQGISLLDCKSGTNCLFSCFDRVCGSGTADVVGTVKAIYLDGKFVDKVEAGNDSLFGVLLDKTSFYAEQGGQTFDVGQLTIDGKMDFMVENVQVYAGYVLHVGYLKYGGMAVGDSVTASYDEVGWNDRLGRLLFPFPDAPNHASTNSSADGPSATTTPLRTSSTLPSAKPSATRSTKRAPSSTPKSSASTFPTNPPSKSKNSSKSRRFATSR